MGYRIVYGPEQVITNQRGGAVRIRVLVALSFLIFAWMVRLLWPQGREVLAMHLLPGESTYAEAAFSELMENIRHGDGMVDALTAFCKDILYEIL